MALISFITVCFNDRANLSKTIDSISKFRVSQLLSGNHIEFIFQDGLSDDGSWDEPDRYSFITKKREKDLGIYDAMNKAASRATGKYLFFLNAGDEIIMDEEYVRKLSYNYLAKTKSQLIAFSTKHINVDGRSWKMKPYQNLSLIKFGNIFSHQGVFFSRELFNRLGGFNTEAKVVADWLLFNQAIKSGCRIEFKEFTLCSTAPFGVSEDFVRRTLERMQYALDLYRGSKTFNDVKAIYTTFLTLPHKTFSAIRVAEKIFEIQRYHGVSVEKACQVLLDHMDKLKIEGLPSGIDFNYKDICIDAAFNNYFDASKLIFIVSMPRSGSTLLQRLMESSQAVFSSSEPWIAIPPLSIHEPSISRNKLGQDLIQEAEIAVIKELNLPKDIQMRCTKKYLETFYQAILDTQPGKLYIDKTPRYMHLLHKLKCVFPAAKYILLLRDPLSVACSYASTWTDYNFAKVYENPSFREDFSAGFKKLIKFAESRTENTTVIYFDDLIKQNPSALNKINNLTGLNLADFSISQNDKQISRVLGDPKTINKHNKPIPKANRDLVEILREFKGLSYLIKILETVDSSVFDHFNISKDRQLLDIKKAAEILHHNEKTNPQKVEVKPSNSSAHQRVGNICEDLTLVITSYNNEKYIRECLQSVYSGMLVPASIIVADDGSDDRSVQIVAEFAQSCNIRNLTLIARDSNLGVGMNRHLAIEQVNTKYFSTLDGDDRVTSLKLFKEVMSIQKEHSQVAFSDIKVIAEQERVFNTRPYHRKETQKLFSYLLTRSHPVPRDLTIETDLYLQSGGFLPGLNIYEDWNLKQRLAYCSRDFSWVHSGVIGTLYNRLEPGLSKRSQLQHCVTQLVAASHNRKQYNHISAQNPMLTQGFIDMISRHDPSKRLSRLWNLLTTQPFDQQSLENNLNFVFERTLQYWNEIVDEKNDDKLMQMVEKMLS